MVGRCKYCGKMVSDRDVCTYCYKKIKKIRELIKITERIKETEQKNEPDFKN